MMLTPEQLWLDRRDKLNLAELKSCGDAMARKIQENTASLLAAADYINTLDQMLNSGGQRIAELDGLLTSASNHCNATANERNELRGRVTELERDRDHWKANHENQVRRARILLERPDMPIERVKAYQRMQELEKDAARYRQLHRGQQWSVIDGIGRSLRADELDAAVDAAMQPTWPEDTSDYGSRIAVIGQNGATGDHYNEDGKP